MGNKRNNRPAAALPPPAEVTVTGIDHHGRGVARLAGKVVFIEGALPGECVTVEVVADKKNHALARCIAVQQASPQRTQPACAVYAQCGGCAWQHIDAGAQVALKQRVWEEQMQRLGGGRPQYLLPAIYGEPWHYRQRGRLHVAVTENRVHIGFLARQSRRVVAADDCQVVPAAVARSVRLWAGLGARRVADWDWQGLSFAEGEAQRAWVLHCGQTPDAAGMAVLHRLQAALAAVDKLPTSLWLQTGSRPARLLLPATDALAYRLSEYGITLHYQPDDFTQVNHRANALMVARAMHWLSPQPGERIIDWFCGLGNFSLPAARLGAQVLGVEGNPAMVARAQANAEANGLATRCHFLAANLFALSADDWSRFGEAAQWLIDPPRAGAAALLAMLAAQSTHRRPRRIVYVSCDPATLARDAATLTACGYVYRTGGMMNVFAHTAHMESLAVFEQPGSFAAGRLGV